MIAVSVNEIARTVVRTLESVLSLVRAPVLYLEELMTDNKVEYFVGIDVSKAILDVAIWESEVYWQFGNEAEGWQELIKRLKILSPKLVVIEASGGLEQPVVAELYADGLPVAVVNPTRVRNFARSTGQLAKTDKLDAKVIAQFAQAVRPKVRSLRTADEAHLNALVTRRRQVITMLTAEKNRKTTTHSTLQEHVQQHIDWLQAELKELEKEIRLFIQQCPVWKEKETLLLSVPGVGPVTVPPYWLNYPNWALGIANRSLP